MLVVVVVGLAHFDILMVAAAAAAYLFDMRAYDEGQTTERK